MNDTVNSLAHTSWNCKYHIVFAPKYRRQVFYKSKRLEIGQILRKLCEFKGVEILEAEVCPDHIHMLVKIPPKVSVSGFVGYLKGKSSIMIFQQWGNAKFKYRNREFWCRGYYVDTVGKNTKKIAEYIRNQIEEDRKFTQLNFDFEGDPFTGSRYLLQAADSKCTLVSAAGKRGLCPKRKNHQLGWWIIIKLDIIKK